MKRVGRKRRDQQHNDYESYNERNHANYQGDGHSSNHEDTSYSGEHNSYYTGSSNYDDRSRIDDRDNASKTLTLVPDNGPSHKSTKQRALNGSVKGARKAPARVVAAWAQVAAPFSARGQLGRLRRLARAGEAAASSVARATAALAQQSVRVAHLWRQAFGDGPYTYGAQLFLDKTTSELGAVATLRTSMIFRELERELARLEQLPSEVAAAEALVGQLLSTLVAQSVCEGALFFRALVPSHCASAPEIVQDYRQAVRFARSDKV